MKADLGLRGEALLDLSRLFVIKNENDWMTSERDRQKPRDSGHQMSSKPAGRTCVDLELPVYRRYENSLHAASKDRIKNLAYPVCTKISHAH